MGRTMRVGLRVRMRVCMRGGLRVGLRVQTHEKGRIRGGNAAEECYSKHKCSAMVTESFAKVLRSLTCVAYVASETRVARRSRKEGRGSTGKIPTGFRPCTRTLRSTYGQVVAPMADRNGTSQMRNRGIGATKHRPGAPGGVVSWVGGRFGKA